MTFKRRQRGTRLDGLVTIYCQAPIEISKAIDRVVSSYLIARAGNGEELEYANKKDFILVAITHELARCGETVDLGTARSGYSNALVPTDEEETLRTNSEIQVEENKIAKSRGMVFPGDRRRTITEVKEMMEWYRKNPGSNQLPVPELSEEESKNLGPHRLPTKTEKKKGLWLSNNDPAYRGLPVEPLWEKIARWEERHGPITEEQLATVQLD